MQARRAGRLHRGGGAVRPGHLRAAGPALRVTPPELPNVVGSFRCRGEAPGERQWGAGTAGVRFGTVWYHREPRPISGPPAAVSPPGVLECLSTLERHFNTPGEETFAVVHTRSQIFVRGCAAANANGRGGNGGHEAPDHYESGGALVPRAVGGRDWDRFPVTALRRPRTRCPPMHTPWPRR
jgi:hypothetical protein